MQYTKTVHNNGLIDVTFDVIVHMLDLYFFKNIYNLCLIVLPTDSSVQCFPSVLVSML